jgi:sugar phosphate permease
LDTTATRRNRPSILGVIGRIMTGAGGIVLIGSFLLHQYGGQSFWAQTTRGPVILTLLASAAACLALITLFRDNVMLVALQLALGFFLFGEVFYVGSTTYSGLQIRFWLGAIAGVVMAVGGLLSIAASASRRRD